MASLDEGADDQAPARDYATLRDLLPAERVTEPALSTVSFWRFSRPPPISFRWPLTKLRGRLELKGAIEYTLVKRSCQGCR